MPRTTVSRLPSRTTVRTGASRCSRAAVARSCATREPGSAAIAGEVARLRTWSVQMSVTTKVEASISSTPATPMRGMSAPARKGDRRNFEEEAICSMLEARV